MKMSRLEGTAGVKKKKRTKKRKSNAIIEKFHFSEQMCGLTASDYASV